MFILRCNMKRSQSLLVSENLLQQLREMGRLLAESRIARKMTQSEAAVRANLGRNTVSRIENGDTSVAIGQILRYLEDRKSTRLNSSHSQISYAVFCLKKK